MYFNVHVQLEERFIAGRRILVWERGQNSDTMGHSIYFEADNLTTMPGFTYYSSPPLIGTSLLLNNSALI